MKLIVLSISIAILILILILMLVKKEEKFDFIPSPPIPIPIPPSEEDQKLITENAERLRNLARERDVKQKLLLPRNYVQTIGFKDRVQIDNQRDWSEGIFGLTYDSKRNRFYTAIEDRERLGVVSADGEALGRLIDDFPLYSDCAVKRDLGSKFGQGSMHSNNYTLLTVTKSCKPAPVAGLPYVQRNLGTYIEFRNAEYPMAGTTGFLENIRADWVASDPITELIFIPPNGSRLSTVNVYVPEYNRSNWNYDMRLVRTPILYKNNVPLTLTGVTAACFSKNGIFYVLSNTSNSLGVHSFLLNSTGTRFNFLEFSRLTRPEVSILGGDAQNFVGITCRDLGARRNSDLLILLRNDDIGTDNFTIYRVTNVW